jgi:hypothetical protein
VNKVKSEDYKKQNRMGLAFSNSFANGFGILVFYRNTQNLLSNNLAIGLGIYSK